MAEDYEFENPTFDDEDIDKDIDEEPETSFTDETEFQRTLTNQYEALNNLRGETQNKHRLNLLKMMVKRFYERNQEPVGFDQDEADWTIKTDRFGRPLFGVESNDKDIPLSYYKSNNPDAILQFHSFDTLQNKYGVKFMRDELGVTNYQPRTARLKVGRAEFQALITAKNEVNAAKEEIPMQEFSTQTDVQKTVDATNQVETSTGIDGVA